MNQMPQPDNGEVMEEVKEVSKNFNLNNTVEASADVQVSYVAGTIEVPEQDRLKKLLFRATRGKALTYFRPYALPRIKVKGKFENREKLVYIVVFQDGRMIRDRITKICDSFMGQRFELPELYRIQDKLEEVNRNIQESK